MEVEPPFQGDITEVTVKRGSNGFGLLIKGGKDQPEYLHDDGVFISGVQNSLIADTLQKGDKILEINAKSTEGLTHAEILTAFSQAPNVLKLKILRGASKGLDTCITRSIDKDGEVSLLVQKELGMPITWKQRPAVQRDVFPRRGQLQDEDEDLNPGLAEGLAELQRARREQL